MKNLKIIATGEVRQNVDNAEAARLVTSGQAVEVPAAYETLGNRDPQKVEHRDPVPASPEK